MIRLTHILSLLFIISCHLSFGQCPEFDSEALVGGNSFCGEELGLLLSATGSNFPNCNGEVTWYIGEPGFNPLVDGTDLGTADVNASCSNDIEVLYMNINPDNGLVGSNVDCGNEFLVVFSGDGVYTDDFTMEFSCPGIFDTFDAGDASVYSGCAGLVEVDQGDFIPANSLIIVQIADGANPPSVNYDISTLCSTGLEIYVIQVLSTCGFGCLDNQEPCTQCPYPISEGCCGSSDNVSYNAGPSTNGMGWSNSLGIGIYGEVVSNFQVPTYSASTQTVDDLSFDLTQAIIDQYCTPNSSTLEIIGLLNDVGATCGTIMTDPITITIGCPEAEDAGPLEACTDPGTGNVIFDLTQLDNTILGSNSGTVQWYEDTNLANDISDPDDYEIDSDEEVYATVFVDGCESLPVEVELIVSDSPTIEWDNQTQSFCENDCVDIPFTITGGTGPYLISIVGTVQLAGVIDINADCNFVYNDSDVLTICLTHTPISIFPPSAGYNCDSGTNTLELPSNLLAWVSPDSGPLMITSIEDLGNNCFGEYQGPDIVITYLDNCNPACTSVVPCDDNDPCTENDQETIGGDGSTICVSCAGTPVAVCTLPTVMQNCDDGNPCTINDTQEVDACNPMEVCVPCAGTLIDCDSGSTTIQPCNDGNANTENDMQVILDCDGTICEPCMGTPTNCDSGTTTVQPCDDGDPCTSDDIETILDSDGTICEPCAGEPLPCGESDQCQQSEPCDDNNDCTINDTQTILISDGSICEPCQGTIIDCSNGDTTTMPCDDGDSNTENDMQTILDCDGTICMPCAGSDVNCDSGDTIEQSCDDNNPCTINDMETILQSDGTICIPCTGEQSPCGTDSSCEVTQPCDDGDACTSDDMETILIIDGVVCMPCAGVVIDCGNGSTTIQPCDDGDSNTENDMQTILDCDGSICEPCEGTVIGCDIQIDNLEILCNDNGTELDDSDDFITVVIELSFDGNTTSYSIENIVTPFMVMGNYGVVQGFDLPLGSAGNGNVELIIFDNNNACSLDLTIMDPGSCSVSPDCLTGAIQVQDCDDGDPCTDLDQETILVIDGTICEPCTGLALSCFNGTTSFLPCDDGNENTINDQEEVLDCDQSICTPCLGEPVVVDVYIPNVISTSSESGNDVFSIYSSHEISIVTLDIYDRWGNRVYHVEAFPINDGRALWDGTFKQKDVNMGVYVYLLVYQFNGTESSISGDVLVLH